jgi:hypothetical protein
MVTVLVMAGVGVLLFDVGLVGPQEQCIRVSRLVKVKRQAQKIFFTKIVMFNLAMGIKPLYRPYLFTEDHGGKKNRQIQGLSVFSLVPKDEMTGMTA